MIEWVQAVPALALALLVVVAPGLAMAWALALRGAAMVAAAPALTVGLGASLAVLFGFVGIGWTPLSAVIGFVLVVALFWVLRRALGLPPLRTEAEGPRWPLVAGVFAGAAILLWQLASYIGAPDAISQTNDAVFHLNAMRYAVDTGNASSLLLSGVQGASGFYPAAWHGVVSLVTQLGVEMTVAVNVVALAFSCAVWPLGCAWLVQVTLRSRAIAGVAGIVSAGFATFPLLLLQWGVLYPLHASMALLPAAIAVWISTTEWGRLREGTTAGRLGSGLRMIGLLSLSAAAIALAQPATLLPLFAAVLLFAIGRVATGWRIATARARIAGAALVLVGAAAVVAAWLVLGALPSSGHWPATLGRAEAAWQVATQSLVGAPARIGLAVAVVAGLVRAILRRDARWLVALWILSGALYVAAIALHQPALRALLVGAWYEDPYRLAALTAVASVPLAALGIDGVVRAALGLLPALRRVATPLVAASSLLVVLATVLVVPPVFMNVVFDGPDVRPNPYRAEEANYLEDDERELIEKLPELVPADSTIVGNPGTGTGFGYALTGMDVIPRSWQLSPDLQDVLGSRLPDVAEDPDVCDVIEQRGIDYVLDFGPGEPYPGRWVLEGFTGFEGQDGFELVAEEGDVSLWEITACD